MQLAELSETEGVSADVVWIRKLNSIAVKFRTALARRHGASDEELGKPGPGGCLWVFEHEAREIVQLNRVVRIMLASLAGMSPARFVGQFQRGSGNCAARET